MTVGPSAVLRLDGTRRAVGAVDEPPLRLRGTPRSGVGSLVKGTPEDLTGEGAGVLPPFQ
jgi:hypothetical protein